MGRKKTKTVWMNLYRGALGYFSPQYHTDKETAEEVKAAYVELEGRTYVYNDTVKVSLNEKEN
jgi:hypothetical protein